MRRLLLPILLALALLVPSTANAAATIETHSVPHVGTLSADLQHTSYGFQINNLTYHLHSCGAAADAGGNCQWSLIARTNVRNDRSCPATEGISASGYTSTVFEHRQGQGLSITLGSGHLSASNKYGLPRQLLCWYVRLGAGHELHLTAHTLVTF